MIKIVSFKICPFVQRVTAMFGGKRSALRHRVHSTER